MTFINLTPDHIARYRADGATVVRGAFTPAQMKLPMRRGYGKRHFRFWDCLREYQLGSMTMTEEFPVMRNRIANVLHH